jgi:sugar lactone lactonase YvrE
MKLRSARGTGFALLALLLPAAAGAQPFVALDPALGELPEGVALDKPGYLWVTVQPLCEVRRYTPGGDELLRVRLVGETCIGANGLAVDATGVAYAAVLTSDEATRGVYAVRPSGEFRRIEGTGRIAYPNAMVFDHHNGVLFVSDMARGAVWRVGLAGVELWVEHPMLAGTLPPPPPFAPDTRLGANGIALRHGAVYVAVTFVPRLVRIVVNEDGSAGAPELLVPPPAFVGAGVFFLDGLQLDVHGNLFIASPNLPGIVRVDGASHALSVLAGPAEGVTAPPLSLAFGTGKGSRKDLFVTINPSFGGAGCGVVRVPAGTPGLPLP